MLKKGQRISVSGNVFSILGPILPALPENWEEIHNISYAQDQNWRDHCWLRKDEDGKEWIYSTHPRHLASAMSYYENQISKQEYIENLKWVAKKYV